MFVALVKKACRSAGAAEILAASGVIDKGKILKAEISKIVNGTGPLSNGINSKELYSSLSTRRKSIDKSIRAVVNVIRFEYEGGDVSVMCWPDGSAALIELDNKTK